MKKINEGDLGLGSPTERLPWWFLLRLFWEQLDIWGYAPSIGLPEARAAVASRKFQKNGVKLDPETNITFSMKGSRMIYPFLIKLILEMVGRIEVVLALPFYPGHLIAARWAGAKVRFVPAMNAKDFVDGLEERLRSGLLNPAVVIVCAIGNPFGYRFDLESYRRLVSLAHEFGFKLIVDEAYAELGYDGTVTASPFQAKDALPVTFVTMTGSKFLSAAAGGIGIGISSVELVAAYNKATEFLSEGGNGLIQAAFAYALPHCDPYIIRLAQMYKNRAYGYAALLEQVGLTNAKKGIGDGGMFLWTPTDRLDADNLVAQRQEFWHYDSPWKGVPRYWR